MRIVFLAMICVATGAVASPDKQAQLYDACITVDRHYEHREAMCECQSKAWAAGFIEHPTNPKKRIPIKPAYIDALIDDWSGDGSIQGGDRLEGDEAQMVGFSFAIGVGCARTLGLMRQQ